MNTITNLLICTVDQNPYVLLLRLKLISKKICSQLKRISKLNLFNRICFKSTFVQTLSTVQHVNLLRLNLNFFVIMVTSTNPGLVANICIINESIIIDNVTIIK